MANNRLFLFNPENNSACFIAKAFGDGWYVPENLDLKTALNTFFDAPDMDCDLASATFLDVETNLRLITEKDLPTNVRYVDGTKPAK